MKSLLFTSFFLGSFFTVYSQTNIFPATGHVGIGTLSPHVSYKLDVVGGGISAIGSETRFSSTTYVDPALGAAFAVKIGNGGLAVRGTTFFNDYVGIGVVHPSEKLVVDGKIKAREVKVDNANWPDYVFSQSYSLPTLEDISTFISLNGHLPGIPSAKEVAANGIDLGDMNARLLKKIEELTLILLEQDRNIKDQNRKIQQQDLLLRKMMAKFP